MFNKSFLLPRACSCLLACLVLAGCAAQQRQNNIDQTISQAHIDGPELKVCAAHNEMPYSNHKGEGFENRITQFLGAKLNRKIKYVYWKDPRYFVRDYLQKGLCDLVIGVDYGDPRMATTQPYYRSGYVFISKKEDKLDLENWDSPVLRRVSRIGFVPATPSEVMLRAIGRYSDMFNYNKELVGFKSRRNQYVKYETSKIVDDVTNGVAEVAVLWAPAASRYVKQSRVPLSMTVIPDNNRRADGQKVDFHYNTSMGVREQDSELLQQLNAFIKNNQDQIESILQEEGIPLLSMPQSELAHFAKDIK